MNYYLIQIQGNSLIGKTVVSKTIVRGSSPGSLVLA